MIKKIAVVFLSVVFTLAPYLTVYSPPVEAQQNSIGQTTLASAIAGSLLGQGVSATTNPPPQLIQVASSTGMVGINPNLGVTASQPNQTMLYVGRKAMLVQAVNGNTLTVVRGYNGTVAAPHVSGDMVLFGPPRFFYVTDPGGTAGSPGAISGVACTANNVVVSPWVNIRSGAQWLCSSVTGTWVPGWNNMAQDNLQATATVASATGTVTPSGPLFSMTGTGAISGFNIPVGFNGTASGGGCFTAIPSSGIWTWTAAGNITTAGTVTAANSVPVTFCWNALTQKWVPSRIA